MAVRLYQVVCDVEQRRAGSRGHIGKRCPADDVHQLRPQHHKAHHVRGVDAVLAIGDWVDFPVRDSVGPAQSAHPVAKPIGKAKARREVVAITAVRQGFKLVHLLRRGDQFVAQAEAQGQVGEWLPSVGHVELADPLAESAVEAAHGLEQAGGLAQPEVGDGVVAEIV